MVIQRASRTIESQKDDNIIVHKCNEIESVAEENGYSVVRISESSA